MLAAVDKNNPFSKRNICLMRFLHLFSISVPRCSSFGISTSECDKENNYYTQYFFLRMDKDIFYPIVCILIRPHSFLCVLLGIEIEECNNIIAPYLSMPCRLQLLDSHLNSLTLWLIKILCIIYYCNIHIDAYIILKSFAGLYACIINFSYSSCCHRVSFPCIITGNNSLIFL